MVTTQRTHDAIITSLWRRNDVAMSFWRHNHVIIESCAVGKQYYMYYWHAVRQPEFNRNPDCFNGPCLVVGALRDNLVQIVPKAPNLAQVLPMPYYFDFRRLPRRAIDGAAILAKSNMAAVVPEPPCGGWVVELWSSLIVLCHLHPGS